jgi:hypothetical protein
MYYKYLYVCAVLWRGSNRSTGPDIKVFVNVVVFNITLRLRDQWHTLSNDPRRIGCCVIRPHQRYDLVGLTGLSWCEMHVITRAFGYPCFDFFTGERGVVA